MKAHNEQEWNAFLDNLLFAALTEYQKSPEREHAKYQRGQIDELLQNNLVEDDRVFVEEVLEDLAHITDNEILFAYRQGFRDCVWVLRELGLVA